MVIGQNPPAGVRLPRGSKVDILTSDTPVSRHPQPRDETALLQRMNSWVLVSLAKNILRLQGRSYYFTTTIQQLGRIDCRLIREDARLDGLTKEQEKSENKDGKLLEHLAISSYWVLGGFQLLWTLESRMKKEEIRFPGLQPEIDKAKRSFARLRNPLAKMWPVEGDYPLPFHAGRFAGSVCWALNPNLVVSRINLANTLLNLLSRIASHGKQENRVPEAVPDVFVYDDLAPENLRSAFDRVGIVDVELDGVRARLCRGLLDGFSQMRERRLKSGTMVLVPTTPSGAFRYLFVRVLHPKLMVVLAFYYYRRPSWEILKEPRQRFRFTERLQEEVV